MLKNSCMTLTMIVVHVRVHEHTHALAPPVYSARDCSLMPASLARTSHCSRVMRPVYALHYDFSDIANISVPAVNRNTVI